MADFCYCVGLRAPRKNINFWKLVRAGFHAILTCGPVKNSLQVDIEIYEDKLAQSGDKILSSHITIYNNRL